MKKSFILSITFLALALCSFGQSFNLSVVAGANYATFYPDQQFYEIPSHSGSTGYQAGLLAAFTRGRLSIQTGAIYEQFASTGSYTATGQFGGSSGTQNFTVHYLQVPVNFLYITPTGFGHIFLGGGPYVSFGLSGNIQGATTFYSSVGPITSIVNTPYQFNSQTDNPDFGVKAIIGIALKNNFLLNLSFDHGIRYMFNGKDNYDNGELGLKNDVVSLSVGYSFF